MKSCIPKPGSMAALVDGTCKSMLSKMSRRFSKVSVTGGAWVNCGPVVLFRSFAGGTQAQVFLRLPRFLDGRYSVELHI